MSKSNKIYTLAILATSVALFNIGDILAGDTSTLSRRYYQQVPHVVLPQTIEYHPMAKTNTVGQTASGAYRNDSPATYTAYPSYQSDEALRFRTINQVSYPITPESPTWSTPQQTAEYWQNHQVQVQKPAWVKEPKKDNPTPQPQASSLYPTIETNIEPDQGQQGKPELQNHPTVEKKWTSSPQSLVFVKSQRENTVPDNEQPGQLLKASVAKAATNPVWNTDWWMNAGDFELALQVSYNQPLSLAANDTSSGMTANMPDYSAILQQAQLQQAQTAPAYTGCMTYGNGSCMGGGMRYGYNGICSRQPAYGCYPNYCQPQQPTYSPQVIQDAWNAYFSVYNAQQSGIRPVSGMTQGMPQMGAQGMPNYGYMAFNPAANAMQQPMPQPMQNQSPQTVGYIVLYPNQNQDGTDGNADGSDPKQNMKAVFVPFDSPQGMNIQSAMNRSEERRVGKECRSRWSPYH